jgi:hypothetical protein
MAGARRSSRQRSGRVTYNEDDIESSEEEEQQEKEEEEEEEVRAESGEVSLAWGRPVRLSVFSWGGGVAFRR